jgi:chromosome segregation protein
MYLKNLTVLGFKSFADKTSLNFQPGLTAIVGPNGCGKSNVSDSIRWVLGEQSAKALRGGEMADVIFNGTDGRKPLGMAEVSLTIGGVDEAHLKVAGIELPYHEVTITRRVFRDGGSEYFINKTGCRLRDIQQLFMGTGVGRTSYSIMAQGNITQILSSKPDDRRMVFEEAAGITKFKAQKKEALRKLEYTDQNLLRVSDLIREVKRQIGSLQRQAGKARRYKTLMIDLQHLDTQLARHQFDVLETEIRERQELTEKLKVEIEVCTESVLRVENEIIQLRERLSELEASISQAQQRGLELKAQAEQHDSRIRFDEERLLELEAQHGKALNDIAQAEERQRAAEAELASVGERLAASQAAVQQHRQASEEKRQAVQQVENELRQRQEQLRQAQAEAFATAQQLSRLRNEVTALDLQKQGNTVRLEKLAAEKIQLDEERRRLENRLREYTAHVEAEKLSVQSRRGTVEERQQRLREIQQQLQGLSQELDTLWRQQAEKRSRLNVLEQLQTEHEGFGAGTLAALKQSQSVLGSLADKIRVPDTYITAVEAALGHHLQLVLTEHPEAAQQIIADLSANKRGRASIAPLALFRHGCGNGNGNGNGIGGHPKTAPAPCSGTPASAGSGHNIPWSMGPSLPAEAGVPGAVSAGARGIDNGTGNGNGAEPAPGQLEAPGELAVPAEAAAQPPLPTASPEPSCLSTLNSQLSTSTGSLGELALPANDNGHFTGAAAVVEAEESVKPLIERLLGGTRIVPDLGVATAAWRESNGTFQYVTLAGEVLSAHGVYTGGLHNGAAGKVPLSILGRKNQIAELTTALGQLQEQIHELSRGKGALQGEQTELQASLQEAQTELRAQEVAIAGSEGELRALQNSQRVLDQKIETVEFEFDTLLGQAQEGAEKRAALAARINEFEAREQSLQQQVAAETAGLEGLRQQREAANASLTETKIALAAEEQLCASFRQQQQPLEQRIRELTQLASQRQQELGTFAQRKTQWEVEIEDSRRRIERLQHEREVVNAQTAQLQTDKEALESDILTREEDLRGQRKRLGDLQQQRGTLEIELAQKAMSVQNLRERIQQKYQLNLETIRSECITITLADEGPPKVHTLTPEEMAAAGVATDWNLVAEQIAALQKRVEEIGPVNLVAIEEYEETEQRHQFLTTQSDDLVKAKEQLLEVINKINTQTQEMFTETFHQIRENFQALFVEIFGGGKADLMLVDEGDVLESGIEIVARPPGKQLQSISLLSGGEQTMTAVALLFSIYQVKPSPFCVLDELDAPLDESNINRFIRILQRFLRHSQFIVITHNKRTIGIADVLYGITMQEHGVSQVVSVKFHKADEQVTDHVPAPLEEAEAAEGSQEPAAAGVEVVK